MRIPLYVVAGLVLFTGIQIRAQESPTQRQASSAASQIRAQGGMDLTESGVRIQPDARLIVMMAALDAAGFDPTPPGQEPSAFRAQIRREQQDLDPELRQRMRVFFERANKNLNNPKPAEQASRYVSLAYALGPPSSFEAPSRTDDLPGGLLDVLDFAPLMREFYRKSGIDERLPDYVRKYQAEGDRLRPTTVELVRSVVSYLHTRPATTLIEAVRVKSGDNKKNSKERFEPRERARNFYIVPDLLAVPGTINFRIIADDYYVIVPFGVNPTSSELRRAYIRFVIDPIILRYNRQIATRRAEIKTLLDERIAAKAEDISPDVFVAVMSSLVAATDVRIEQAARTEAVTREARTRIETVKDADKQLAIRKELEASKAAINDEAVAQLSEAYERGAVLAFYFHAELEGIEASGFDIANFFGDMITGFEPTRESGRLTANAEARKRALEARKFRQAQLAANPELSGSAASNPLIKGLSAVDDLLRVKNYKEAETRLLALMKEFQAEPRIFFALGQAASLSAEDATDEDVQRERLGRAVAQYRLAINAATPETDRGLIQRTYARIGRIQEFLENTNEAAIAYDAAIKMGPIDRTAYDDAVKGKAGLGQK